MDVAVNPACFRWGTSLPEFVRASSDAGFAHVEVNIQQAVDFAAEHGLRALVATLDRAGVAVEQMNGIIPAGPVLPAPLLVSPALFDAAVATLGDRLRVAEALGCQRAAVVVNPFCDGKLEDAAGLARERLELLAERAAPYGITLAVEFIAARRLPDWLSGTRPFVRDLGALLTLLDSVAAPNVGVLLDTCHVYASGLDLASVRAQLQGRIAFVQVSDVPAGVAPVDMEDGLRLLPGAGVLDFAKLDGDLSGLGYDGPWSIELFSQQIWQHPAPGAARLLYDGCRALKASTAQPGLHA